MKNVLKAWLTSGGLLELFESAQQEANRRNYGYRRSDHGISGAIRSVARVGEADARLARNVGGVREDGKVSMDEVNTLFSNYNH